MLSKNEFAKYYDLYSDKIYNYVFFKVNDEQISYDLTSQIFFKALKKLDSFDEIKASFKTWLYTIAHNEVVDYFKTSKRSEDIENFENILNYSDDISLKIDTKINLKNILKELNKLQIQTKKIIVLRIYEELSFDEISNILNISS